MATTLFTTTTSLYYYSPTQIEACTSTPACTMNTFGNLDTPPMLTAGGRSSLTSPMRNAGIAAMGYLPMTSWDVIDDEGDPRSIGLGGDGAWDIGPDEL